MAQYQIWKQNQIEDEPIEKLTDKTDDRDFIDTEWDKLAAEFDSQDGTYKLKLVVFPPRKMMYALRTI